MLFDLEAYGFIDNHAHSLLKENRYIDADTFRQAFSESRSPELRRIHLPEGLHYRCLLKQLGALYGHIGEPAIMQFRSEQNTEELLELLWNAASIEALIIDNGFNSQHCLSIKELSGLAKRPVYLCRRIEPVLEELIVACASLDEVMDLLPAALIYNSPDKPVALKTICGYRGGLAINTVSCQEAKESFAVLKAGIKDSSPWRLTACPVYHYLLLHCFEIAAQYQLPVQIHTGIGDDDAELVSCNPALLQPLFRSSRFEKTSFILLHCYPYVREAAFLASIYANVFMDLSLSVSLAHSQAASLISEALALAPVTKILAGSDGHSVPEAHWFGALSWKQGLQQALGQLTGTGYCSEEEAAWLARRLLKDNTAELYCLSTSRTP